jgi:hypothetical protein
MKNLLFPVFAILALSSCTHSYYLPASPNVPLFQEKNEVRATGGIGLSERAKTMNAQVAYSITNHIAVGGTYMNAFGGTPEKSRSGKGEYKDLALGYFYSAKNQFALEVFGGFAHCDQKHVYSEIEGSNLSFNKIFLQPSFGYSDNIIDVAMTPTLSRIQFNSISTNIKANNSEFLNLEHISNHRTSYLFEPTVTLRLGWKYVKLQGQMTFSKNLSRAALPYDEFHLNAGVSFAFAQRMLQKNKPKANKDDKRRSKNLNGE